ncbi:MAG: GNAT family N-acetyltransferase [Defluviitaleaceae bacterium]|nr:GNAT family N-acetyltransferase [Defluviitaleaceae bacterium]
MKKMTIRDMEVIDMEALSELYSIYWGEKSNVAKMRDKFSRFCQNPAYIFLCACEGDRLVGSVCGTVCEDLYGDCHPFVVAENMAVDKNFQRKGIGKALFSELTERAKALGCSQILLVTESEREDACKFYESLGFHPTAKKGFKKKI